MINFYIKLGNFGIIFGQAKAYWLIRLIKNEKNYNKYFYSTDLYKIERFFWNKKLRL